MIKVINKNKTLGKEVKKLEFKILKFSKYKKMRPMYHIIVARKRSGSNSRLDKVGFFHFAETIQNKKLRLLALDFEKVNDYIKKGVTFHRSVFKFII